MISAIVPWKNSGPGWSSTGLTVQFADGSTETVLSDPREMGLETLTLLPHFLSLYNAILLEVATGRHKVAKKRAKVAVNG